MQTTLTQNEQGVIVVSLEKPTTQAYKIQVVGTELVIYPAHLKFFEVATPEQQARFLEEWANSPKSAVPSQVSDESLRREHLYE
jgi:hypothetical protein